MAPAPTLPPVETLILGGGGMLGRKLAESLARDPEVGDAEVSRLVLADLGAEPAAPAGAPFPVDCRVADVADRAALDALVASRPALVVHLAAVVSGEAETDLEKGYAVNLDGVRALLDAIRLVGGDYRPRLVFTSSIAAFGAPFPDVIGDDVTPHPLNSYGAQKIIGETLITDYTRRGIVDGISLRCPSICVRPGAANKAASGVFSNIIREPLTGREAVLPVSPETAFWCASPRSAVGFMRHAAELDLAALGPRRALNMPGLTATVADEIEALRRVGGDAAVARVRPEPDPLVEGIVTAWPARFDTARADAAGFTAERSFDEIVRVFVEDELGGVVP